MHWHQDENNRNSTTHPPFKADYCLRVHNAHLKWTDWKWCKWRYMLECKPLESKIVINWKELYKLLTERFKQGDPLIQYRTLLLLYRKAVDQKTRRRLNCTKSNIILSYRTARLVISAPAWPVFTRPGTFLRTGSPPHEVFNWGDIHVPLNGSVQLNIRHRRQLFWL